MRLQHPSRRRRCRSVPTRSAAMTPRSMLPSSTPAPPRSRAPAPQSLETQSASHCLLATSAESHRKPWPWSWGHIPKHASHPPPTRPDSDSPSDKPRLLIQIREAVGRLGRLDDTQRAPEDHDPATEPVTPQSTRVIIFRKLSKHRNGRGIRGKLTSIRPGRELTQLWPDPSPGSYGSLARLARMRSALPPSPSSSVSSANSSGLAGVVGQRRSSKDTPRSRSRTTATTVGATAR